MAKRAEKIKAFNIAFDIAKKHASGGSEKATPAEVLKETYLAALEVIEEINKTED